MKPLPSRLAWLGPCLALACAPAAPERPGVLTVSKEQQGAWVRNFNPLLATDTARWPTTAGIYEPLLIYNTIQGEWVPWLATEWSWEGHTRLRFVVRDDVRWSDGVPLSVDDVLFTFHLLRDERALDAGGLWTHLADVRACGSTEVVFEFEKPWVPGLKAVASVPIVPAHRWREVEDPTHFANPDPVGTGPFTEVLLFEPQIWELGRNPHYWQEGRPAVEALRFPALPGNDQATLALIDGEIDWAGNFVPAIDRIFVDRDPEHHGYWFPAVGSTVFLYLNTTSPPLDDPRVRTAISHAIDRDLVVKVAMYDYATPSHPTGLSDGYRSWRIEPGTDWTRHDPEQARRLLDEAGLLAGSGGLRRGPDGQPLDLEITAPSGWSDWVRAAQVIARNLHEVGLDAHVRTYDFSAWFDQLQRGDFEASLGWCEEGPTPYEQLRGLLSAQSVRPVGQTAVRNWHRFGSDEADALIGALERTTDEAEQRRLAASLQEIFLREAPAIPLFPSPSWGEYSTARFTGFPTADDPYARLSPNHPPETLLVLTRLEPREGAR